MMSGGCETTESKRPAHRTRTWPLANGLARATVEEARNHPEALECDAVPKERVALARFRRSSAR